MKTLVTYISQTGNTQKVALAIYDEIPAEKELHPFSEVRSTDDFDLLFVGFPIQVMNPIREARTFLRNHARGKRTALFITHAADEKSRFLRIWLKKCERAAAQAELVGVFHCRGEMTKDIAEMLVTSDNPDLQAFGKRYHETIGQPSPDRLERARAFAREIIEKEMNPEER